MFDIRDRTSAAGTIEYRFGRKVFVAGLSLGLMANTEGGLYGYVGTYGDLSYKRIYFPPQIAMGGYHDGDSADLGGVFQFRLSLDVAYRFDNGHRVGVRAAHISNGGVNEQNRRGGAVPDLFDPARAVPVRAQPRPARLVLATWDAASLRHEVMTLARARRRGRGRRGDCAHRTNA